MAFLNDFILVQFFLMKCHIAKNTQNRFNNTILWWNFTIFLFCFWDSLVYFSVSLSLGQHTPQKKLKNKVFLHKKHKVPLILALFHSDLFFICLPIYLYWVSLGYLLSFLCWCCVIQLWRASWLASSSGSKVVANA